jgi:hypothetical protein
MECNDVCTPNELRRASAKILLCFAHCWHAVGTVAAKAYLFCNFHKEECCSMRTHPDRKRPDGAALALVVITLLTVIALEILLSRLYA